MNLLTKKTAVTLIFLISASGFMIGCGKKPSDVKAPPHVTVDTYPQAYPKPDTIPNL